MRHPYKRKRQRGIALLMTLGVLSLLLILAMSFSYQAQTERMAASNSAETVRARLLSESCLERILAGLAFNFDGTDDEDIYPPRTGTLFATPYTSGTYTQHYWINTSGTDNEGFATAVTVDGLPSGLATILSAGRWVHIMENETTRNLDGTAGIATRIVGRLAFLVLDESGKIDASAVVTPNHEPFTDLNSDGNHDSNEHYFDVDNNGSYTTTYVAESGTFFTGGSLQEVVVADDALRTNLPFLAAGTERTQWFSLPHLLGVMGDTYYMKFGTHGYDIDAWAKPLVGGGWTDMHRFDLSGHAWDSDTSNTTSGWDDVHSVLNDADYVTWLQGGGGTREFWDSNTPPGVKSVITPTTSTSGGGIPWIGAIIGDNANAADQVAANIIDYCDSDDIPTRKPDTGDPDVVGLEMVPYLNEIAVDIAYQRHPDPGVPTQDEHLVTLTVYCEVVNMYDQPSSAITVTLDADFLFDTSGSVAAQIPDDSTQNITAEIDVSSIAANSYHARYGGSAPQIQFTKTWRWGPTASSANSRFRMTVKSIKASVLLDDSTSADDNALLDFAYIQTDSPRTGFLNPASDGLAVQYFNSLEVEDPRANTDDSDWPWKENSFKTFLIDTLDAKNSVSDATSGDDTETVADPASGLSTAYIRNGPMKSLWELGAIHRGDAWRTINLRDLGDPTDSSHDYDDGDAGILDQVKIGPQTIVRDKINANSPNEMMWAEILSDLNYDDGYSSPGSGSSNASSLANGAATGDGDLQYRGGLATVFAGLGSTDREQEATLGKIANFLTVSQNIFTVVIVAQAVKDLGDVDPGGGATTDRYYQYEAAAGPTPAQYCARVAEQRILAVVYRDAFQNTYRIERFQFLED